MFDVFKVEDIMKEAHESLLSEQARAYIFGTHELTGRFSEDVFSQHALSTYEIVFVFS